MTFRFSSHILPLNRQAAGECRYGLEINLSAFVIGVGEFAWPLEKPADLVGSIAAGVPY